jgi:hypothetical protein
MFFQLKNSEEAPVMGKLLEAIPSMKGQDKMTPYFGCTIFPQNVYRTVITQNIWRAYMKLQLLLLQLRGRNYEIKFDLNFADVL